MRVLLEPHCTMPDRFPPPWYVTETEGASFAVRDATGFVLTYFYYDDRRHIGTGFDRLTRKQAYALAKNFAKLPALLLGERDTPQPS